MERLGRYSWFHVGGAAKYFAIPYDGAGLQDLLRRLPSHESILVMGAASNLLIRDGGFDGIVIRLQQGFQAIDISEPAQKDHPFIIKVGAGVLDIVLARNLASLGIGGLEFLIGIPGTLGGAVAMNAGAYGSEIGQHLLKIEGITRGGERQIYNASELGFAYRHCELPANFIITDIWLKGYLAPDGIEAVQARMEKISQERQLSQPVRMRTGGSTFKNPHDDKRRAWELIDQAGCRGMKIGGAMVSPLHCNFLINTGTANAFQLEQLGEQVRQKVHFTTGINLEWEIIRCGKAMGETIILESNGNG